MAVTVAASSLKEALELLAADIADCCGCSDCCATLECGIDGETVTSASSSITINDATICPCDDCEVYMPLSYVSDGSEDLPHPGYNNCIFGVGTFIITVPKADPAYSCRFDVYASFLCRGGVITMETVIQVISTDPGSDCFGSDLFYEDTSTDVTITCVENGVILEGTSSDGAVDVAAFLSWA